MQLIIDHQQQIGGIIIEIDKAKLGKRKYNKSSAFLKDNGKIEQDSVKLFIVPVSDRSSDILISIITHHIAPGSIIYSDS